MNAKRELTKYREYNHKINSKTEQAKEFKELAMCLKSIDYSKERVQISTGNEASFEKNIIKAIELEREILDSIDDLFRAKVTIENLIENLSNPLQRSVLRYRYINGFTFESIAEKLEISKKWAMELEGRGLHQIDIILLKKRISLP